MDGPTETLGDEPAMDQDTVLLGSLPKEVGVFLLAIGIGGILLPGPVGAPFFLLGGVVLFPRAFGPLEQKFRNRFPDAHTEAMKRVRRFVGDLERRYPSPPST
jgi:hypothetical protein